MRRFEVEEDADPGLLATPLPLGPSGRVAKNRFLKAALSENLGSWHRTDLVNSGLPSQGTLNLYEKWANGGWGIVLTGNIMVHHAHLECAGNVIVSKETHSELKDDMLRKYAALAKANDTLAIAQINHAGRQTPSFVNDAPFAPSALEPLSSALRGFTFGKPVEFTTEQVQTEVVDRFAYTAKKLYEAGFDGVQLHSAHGYLLAQFLTPSTNKRTDKYGGSVENRSRILVDIYNAIRRQVPRDFIIGIKLNSVEFQDGANGLPDDTGFDFVEFSGGTYEAFAMCHKKESTRRREAFFIEVVEAIRPHLKRSAVYLTGGFKTVPAMCKAIREGATDGIGFGRPNLPNQMIAGSARSVLFSPAYNDYMLSAAVCHAQMTQAAVTTLTECEGNVNAGILDPSDEGELQDFIDEIKPIAKEREMLVAQGEPPLVPFVFKSKAKTAKTLA